MGFIDFIKRIFGFLRKKDVSKENMDKIVELANSEKKIDVDLGENSEIILTPNDEANKEQKEEPIIENEDKITIHAERENTTRFLQIDKSKLDLEKIEREAETITTYLKILVKDIALYKEGKSETRLKSITTKYKMILMHSMELKNLLSFLNEQFHEYLLKNLSDTNESRKEIEENQKEIMEMITLLTKIGLYDEVFNPEKTSEYEKNIDSESEKGVFAKDCEELAKILNDKVNNRKNGVSFAVNKIMQKIKEQQK